MLCISPHFWSFSTRWSHGTTKKPHTRAHTHFSNPKTTEYIFLHGFHINLGREWEIDVDKVQIFYDSFCQDEREWGLWECQAKVPLERMQPKEEGGERREKCADVTSLRWLCVSWVAKSCMQRLVWNQIRWDEINSLKFDPTRLSCFFLKIFNCHFIYIIFRILHT